ncbi:MAG: MFS transporter [Elusimicrobium sp.]|uniref:MFS transporter n=1 Tax=Candidatus Avelusimicrobium gallicola TaxID=2562704 RepID=A0A928DRF5_9BACT|nr:MFS transporter [Elusimicrobium sp.]
MKLLTINSPKTPLKLILTTEAFSSFTNQFMQILLPWYILSTTGSVLWTGFVGFCALLPNIFSSLFGAPLIDKAGRSKAMFTCEVIQFLLLGSIPVLIAFHCAWPWLIGILIFLSSFFDAPGQLARTALSPTFSRYAGVAVSKTAGIVQSFDGIMCVAGPIVGGTVIACCGLFSAWVLCAVFCLIIVIICTVLYSNRKPRTPRRLPSYAEVWQNLRTDRTLWEPMLFMLPTFILGESWELILLPAYIYEHGFNAVYLGALGAAFGFGAFLGAIGFAKWAGKFSFSALLTCNYMGYLLSIVVLYFKLPTWAVLGATGLCGIPFGAFGAMINSIILLRTPTELRSKTLGLFATATYTVESCCVLGIAFCIHCCGLADTLFGAGTIFAILVFVSIFIKKKEDFWRVLSSEENKLFTK